MAFAPDLEPVIRACSFCPPPILSKMAKINFPPAFEWPLATMPMPPYLIYDLYDQTRNLLISVMAAQFLNM